MRILAASVTQKTLLPAIGAQARRSRAWWVIVITLATLAVYANSLSTPFIFDDLGGIVENPTLRRLWPPGAVLSPPLNATGATGRPVVNLSLALNYAVGGLDVRGYHALNLALHLGSALALFGLLRRTLLQLRWLPPDNARPLAGVAALLWAIHPLQTESVTFVIQRSELLGGFFYLLTCYAFVRAAEAAASWWWSAVCVLCAAFGMASKEFVATAPLLVLLYDRTFLSGSFAEAWRRRRALYLGLVATWGLLAVLMARSAARGGSVGFGLGVSSWEYLLTQCRAIVLYLRLAVWPHPLVLDYGDDLVRHLPAVLPQAVLLVALFAATVFAVIRRWPGGVAGAAFFALLAPSSSVVPLVTQTIAEHRMYLPLAPLLVLMVLGVHWLAPRWSPLFFVSLSLALGVVTVRRNADYRSVESIWTDTVAKQPANPRAHVNLGKLRLAQDQPDAAIAHYREALRLRPDDPRAHANLADVLSRFGHFKEAQAHLAEAVRGQPASAPIRVTLATALDRSGRLEEALAAYRQALALDPRLPETHSNLGDALVRHGEPAAAIPHLETALRLRPDYAEAHYHLATALARTGRLSEARQQFASGLALAPDDLIALSSWADALAAAGATEEAAAVYRAVLQRRPNSTDTHYNYAGLLASTAHLEEAMSHYREAIRLRPDFAPAHNNLGNTLLLQQHNAEAAQHYREAIRLQPDNATAENNLGLALARLGGIEEAATHFAQAVRLRPDYADARANLARAEAQLRAP